jgi:hypothetical protein
MEKQVFIDRLKKAGISQKIFAEKTKVSYKTVNNWNDTNRPVPSWVDSWLENYEKAQHMDRVCEAVHPYMPAKKDEE